MKKLKIKTERQSNRNRLSASSGIPITDRRIPDDIWDICRCQK